MLQSARGEGCFWCMSGKEPGSALGRGALSCCIDSVMSGLCIGYGIIAYHPQMARHSPVGILCVRLLARLFF